MSEGLAIVSVKPATLHSGVQTPETIAYHEAGHAIMRRLCGLHFDSVGLRVDHGFVASGKTTEEAFKIVSGNEAPPCSPLPDVSSEFRKPLAFRRCCVALAGLQAELLYHGIELPGGPIVRHDHDHKRGRNALIDSTGRCTNEQLYYAELQTRRYLELAWMHVHGTAMALLERFDATGEGILCADNPADARFFQRLPGWSDE